MNATTTQPVQLVITLVLDTRYRGRDARWTVNLAAGDHGRTHRISTAVGADAPTARASAWLLDTFGLDINAWDRIGDTVNWRGRVL